MNEILLVDTSFLVALVDGKDVLHEKARNILKKIGHYDLMFTDVVYTETISVFSRRIWGRRTVPEEKKSEVFREKVGLLDEWIWDRLWLWYPLLKEHMGEIKKICLESGGKLNFNDAFLVFGAGVYGVEKIVSFDSDFDGYMERIW
ncbi:type II toxin-antitoxin system VapC family toxin [Thermodesulfatator atlanticus]|uniref:type II toxin-antitoxin system VapC family toxin n=1 Tax=Thermodesulfatator atlanticus TaxID=501497 RepID=UPI0003B719DF|nr:type II toxin-antitoxin system VapC family toxin [Thermodesulfatator atlanticus]